MFVVRDEWSIANGHNYTPNICFVCIIAIPGSVERVEEIR